ncbi:MAG: tetratricopeptide repeat protein [Cryomorphaceae bacterium]|nr:MAG: tetratricopeptide repeat protein [Cryomorphaceae bacterium]
MTNTYSDSDIPRNRLRMIEEMLETNPDDSFLRYAAALEYRKAGEMKRALQTLQNLVAHDPDYLGSYYQLGKLLEESGDADEAMKVYHRGLTIAQKKQDAKTLGELQEAIMLLED